MRSGALLFLALALLLPGCPDDDDDSGLNDDDDVTADDDDVTADDDDATADDDDAADDDDDATDDDDDDDDSAVDNDSDGSPADLDCDDADPANFPGNTEICDGQDNDCDGLGLSALDETPPWYWMVPGSERLRGDVILATENLVLRSFATWIEAPVGTAVDLLVYTASTEDGTYTLHSQIPSTVTNTGPAWLSSGTLAMEMAEGTYYLFVAFALDDVEYAGSPVGDYSLPLDLTVGELIGGAQVDDVSAVPATISAFSAALALGTVSMTWTVETEGDGDGDGTPFCADEDDADPAVP